MTSKVPSKLLSVGTAVPARSFEADVSVDIIGILAFELESTVNPRGTTRKGVGKGLLDVQY